MVRGSVELESGFLVDRLINRNSSPNSFLQTQISNRVPPYRAAKDPIEVNPVP